MHQQDSILETGSLYLRQIVPKDAETVYMLNLDQEVIRYTGDRPFTDIDTARKFLVNYDHYKKYGFGRWAVINKQDNVFLGWCGLKYSANTNDHDIGFRFFRKYWNKGYATESANACIEYGFGKLGLPFIVGRALKANVASIRVLEKIGLTYLSDFDFEGHDGVIYKRDG
jgi:[ribosomal protein S5]-alanine N-acetyltransferase